MSFQNVTTCQGSSYTPLMQDSLHLEVKIIIVDKSSSHGPFPFVYQLPQLVFQRYSSIIDLCQNIHHSRQDLVFLGEASQIEKKSKKIFLCNGNMLSYEYFIEVIGIQNFEPVCSQDFLTGLDCLQEALRIRGSIQLKNPNENHSLLKQTHHWKKNISLASKVPFLKLPYVKANGNRLNLGKTFRVEV
jgi:NADH dehydrogenase FAD-containing subunit